MPFIGNQPALAYTSFAVQHFTTSATTSYTLDYPVANENEIRLVINNVVQQPGSSYAYTASGTSLTLSAATTGTDTMYAVFLGKAVQTVNPPNGSVGLSQLSATGTKDSTTFLRGDNTFSTVSSDYVLLASTEASSSASVSFDGYFSSTYKTYQVIVNNMIGSTNNQEHYIRLRTSNADITTSTYKFIVHTGMRNSSSDSTLLGGGWNASFIRMAQNSTSSTASRGGANAMLYIANPLNTTSQKMIYGESCAYNEGESEWYSSNFSANNSTTSALSGITFYMQSGNIASGNFKLYGIK